jgi:hypothetical protein
MTPARPDELQINPPCRCIRNQLSGSVAAPRLLCGNSASVVQTDFRSRSNDSRHCMRVALPRRAMEVPRTALMVPRSSVWQIILPGRAAIESTRSGEPCQGPRRRNGASDSSRQKAVEFFAVPGHRPIESEGAPPQSWAAGSFSRCARPRAVRV